MGTGGIKQMSVKGQEKKAWTEAELKKCRRKKVYVTADLARDRAEELHARAYRCRWCDLWHLTSLVDAYESAQPLRCPDCDSAQCAKSGNHKKVCTKNRVYAISERAIRNRFTEFLFGV